MAAKIKIKMLERCCQEKAAMVIKMVGKIYKELPGPSKAYIEKQNTYCLKYKERTNNKSIMPKQVVNKLTAQKSI